MRFSAGFLLMVMLVLWSSCRSDFELSESLGELKFSKDTVFLDTVFSNLSTSTYTLKVYNPTREDIYIPEVTLQNGEGSMYRLNVDGVPGKSFENIEILARDSIYIFIETTVASGDANEHEFLYIDKLQFKSRTHLQVVPLVTLVKDAVLMFPAKNAQGLPETISIGVDNEGNDQRFSGFYLKEEQLEFKRDKPYVIYGYAAVPEDKVLRIEAGARVYFHANSGIIVPENASLQVEGSRSNDSLKQEKEVIFQGDRLEGIYENIPGQWGAIWLMKGSQNNFFRHTTIKNAGVGILIEGTPDTPTPLELKNVQIYNSAVSGILAENAEIYGENVVINRSGKASLHLIGGKYEFLHSTIVNYWQQSYREFPAVYLENISAAGPVPLKASFFNSIIFGNEAKELGYNIDEAAPFDIFFSHSLIKYNGTPAPGTFYDFNNETFYQNIRLNEDPIFRDPKINELQIQRNSAAIDRGSPEYSAQVPLDISGKDRTTAPDLGAYEYEKKPE